jgi:hypothetical protein
VPGVKPAPLFLSCAIAPNINPLLTVVVTLTDGFAAEPELVLPACLDTAPVASKEPTIQLIVSLLVFGMLTL